MAINRYQTSLQQKVLPNGKVVYKPIKPTSVMPGTANITLVANQDDRMDIMANNVYGTPDQWWRIASVNSLADGTLYIKPGTTILIPTQ